MWFVSLEAYDKMAKNVYRLEGLRVCFSNSASNLGQKRFFHEGVLLKKLINCLEQLLARKIEIFKKNINI